ncbi:hypothetical protein Esti_002246 [Eimeria stiedai]
MLPGAMRCVCGPGVGVGKESKRGKKSSLAKKLIKKKNLLIRKCNLGFESSKQLVGQFVGPWVPLCFLFRMRFADRLLASLFTALMLFKSSFFHLMDSQLSAVGRRQGGGNETDFSSRRKKRRWFQPKDKSRARKKFLKVRDARALSQFSRLQKKRRLGASGAPATTAAAAAVDDTFLPPIASADDDNDDFLQRLMDPFARAKSSAPVNAADGGQSSEQELESSGSKRKARVRKGSDVSAAAARSDANPASVTTGRPSSGQAQEGLVDGRAPTAGFESSGEVMGVQKVKGVQKKGYMPFVKAQQAFEAKQREKEAARLAREEEARKIALGRKEKKRLDKFAHKKLQARTKKGQMVMGNVMDVLLLKMQRSAQKQ